VSKQIVRTAALLFPAQVILRGTEALLPLLLATLFGRSVATDVYYFSWALFSLAGSLVFAAYQDSAVVPILAEAKKKDASALPALRGALVSYTLLVGGGISLLIGLAATAYFRFKYGAGELELAGKMVIPFCFFLVALSMKTLLFALLSAEKKFFRQPIMSAAGVLCTLGTIWGMHRSAGVACVPVGQLAGELTTIALTWIFARRTLDIRLSLTVTEPLRRFVRLIAAEVSGGAVTRVNPVVDQLMAGMANVPGGGTLLRYSGDVSSLPTSLLQAALLPVLLSHLSDDYAERHFEKLRSTVRRAIIWVTLAALATSGILLVVRVPLLRLAFLHGEMDEGGVLRMAQIVPYHLVGVASFGALLVLARAHVAIQNSGIMISMGFLNATANAVFNVILLQVLGLEGIALSTSMMQTVVAVVFFIRFERRMSQLIAREAQEQREIGKAHDATADAGSRTTDGAAP
jgi:putative peptidoglycan lipid II flippase